MTFFLWCHQKVWLEFGRHHSRNVCSFIYCSKKIRWGLTREQARDREKSEAEKAWKVDKNPTVATTGRSNDWHHWPCRQHGIPMWPMWMNGWKKQLNLIMKQTAGLPGVFGILRLSDLGMFDLRLQKFAWRRWKSQKSSMTNLFPCLFDTNLPGQNGSFSTSGRLKIRRHNKGWFSWKS